jgi:hypothetical protein
MRHIKPEQMPLLVNELCKLCEKKSVEEAIQPDSIKKVLEKLIHPHTYKSSSLARKRRSSAGLWKTNRSISQKAA